MPKAGAEPLRYPSSKPAFPELFKGLANDGKRWLEAELAKAEAGLRLRSYAAGLAIAFVALTPHRRFGCLGAGLCSCVAALCQRAGDRRIGGGPQSASHCCDAGALHKAAPEQETARRRGLSLACRQHVGKRREMTSLQQLEMEARERRAIQCNLVGCAQPAHACWLGQGSVAAYGPASDEAVARVYGRQAPPCGRCGRDHRGELAA